MDASALARLPPELMNFIYELVLHQRKPIELFTRVCRGGLERNQQELHLLAVTETCKQMRRESLSIFYGTNTFTMTSGRLRYVDLVLRHQDFATECPQRVADSYVRATHTWMASLGQAATHVRAVSFDLGTWYLDPDDTDAISAEVVAAACTKFGVISRGLKIKPTIIFAIDRALLEEEFEESLCLEISFDDIGSAQATAMRQLSDLKSRMEEDLDIWEEEEEEEEELESMQAEITRFFDILQSATENKG